MRVRAAPNGFVVVGADLSLRATALVALRGDVAVPEVLAVRRMPQTKLHGIERLSEIVTWVLVFFDDLAFRALAPVVVLFEGPGYGSQVAHALGQLHGVVKLELWRRDLQLADVPPSTLKKFLTGSGNADKNVVMKTVFKRWAFDSDDDNECDAFGCALVGLCHLGSGTATQQKALAGKVIEHARRSQSGGAADRDQARQVAGRARRRVV